MLQLSALVLDITNCLRCQPFTVQITFSRRMRDSVDGTFIARRVEIAECTCIRTTSGFRKCDIVRSATTLILLARTDCVDESHTPPL